MTIEQALYHAPRCWRCELPNNVGEHVSEGWCLFCRCYAAEQGFAQKKVEIWHLLSDKTPRRCEPAQLGDWTTTGRETVAINLLDLRGTVTAMLLTRFLCVDYWPQPVGRSYWPQPVVQSGGTPLLFETRLIDQKTSAGFDDATRRYATHPEALQGHKAVLAQLVAAQAVVCR
jgi:hypothetical protein